VFGKMFRVVGLLTRWMQKVVVLQCAAVCVAVRVAVCVALCCTVLQRGVFGCLARCLCCSVLQRVAALCFRVFGKMFGVVELLTRWMLKVVVLHCVLQCVLQRVCGAVFSLCRGSTQLEGCWFQ